MYNTGDFSRISFLSMEHQKRCLAKCPSCSFPQWKRMVTSLGYVSQKHHKQGGGLAIGSTGRIPVAWQPIWPAALHFFLFFIIYYYFYILLLLLPTECTKVIISEFAIQ